MTTETEAAGTEADAPTTDLDSDDALIPDDAGPHREGLRRILGRIPDGWGRWIGCGPGWYPLIIELDTALAEVCANYELYQVKEKYGTLRYYAEPPPMPDPACCAAFDAAYPHPGRPAAGDTAAQAAHDQWREHLAAHFNSDEHQTAWDLQYEAWSPTADAATGKLTELVDAAEKRSATVCEQCGAPGTLRVHGGWCRTTCDGCATQPAQPA